jgi:DNA-binding transcriptional LysR family regulator
MAALVGLWNNVFSNTGITTIPIEETFMARRNKDSDAYLGQRLKLRELQILLSVAQFGSMAKAAAHLATTQPAVSQAIAELEEAVGVRLFDRSTQGVVPTIYGDVLLRRGAESFDALKQAIREIEFLATAGAGDVWVGCHDPTLYGLAPAVIQRLAKLHPKIVVHATYEAPSAHGFDRLRNRTLDLIVAGATPSASDDDLNAELLYEESFCIVTAAHSPWARRRNVALADLFDESWIFGEPSNVMQMRISEVFRAKVGALPRISVFTVLMNLRLALLASGNYVSCIPKSVYRYGAQGHRLKALPIDIGLKFPIQIFTLKNRTLSPAATHFIESSREVAKSMGKKTSVTP